MPEDIDHNKHSTFSFSIILLSSNLILTKNTFSLDIFCLKNLLNLRQKIYIYSTSSKHFNNMFNI